MKNEITLQDFRDWYFNHEGFRDSEKYLLIEQNVNDPESEAFFMLWLFQGDLSTPPPSIPQLPTDQIPQEFSHLPMLEEFEREMANASSKRVGVRSATSWLRHPSTLITVASVLVASIVMGLLSQFWQNNANAGIVRDVYIFYSEVDKANFKLLNSALSLPSQMSPENRKAVIDELIPDLDRLMTVFNKGALLRESDPTLRMAKAKALVGRARLRRALGGTNDDNTATVDLDGAMAIYAKLPPSMERDLAIADVALSRTAILGPQRKFQEAIDLITPVVATLEGIVKSQPEFPDARFRLARLLSNRANCLRGLAQTLPEKDINRAINLLNEAEAAYRRAIELVEYLVRNGTSDKLVIEWDSRLNGNLGLLLIDLAAIRGPGAIVDAQKCFENAVAVADRLVNRSPASLTAQDAQVAAVINLGDGFQAGKLFIDAEAAYKRAVTFYDGLQSKYPGLREFIWGQALARKSLGSSLLQLGKKKEAEDMLKDAKNRYDNLVKLYPNVLEIAAERDDLIQIMGGLQ